MKNYEELNRTEEYINYLISIQEVEELERHEEEEEIFLYYLNECKKEEDERIYHKAIYDETLDELFSYDEIGYDK